MRPESANLNKPLRSTSLSFAATSQTAAYRLTEENTAEVLRFLGERRLDTFVMSGFIRDNGLESELNRGTFYGCRNAAGALEGVALIGHAMFIDARSDAALRQFAQLAQGFPRTHMMLGEQQMAERFWSHYANGGQPSRRRSREVLFQLSGPVTEFAPVPKLRAATVDELSLIVPIHAALAFEESGVNPLDQDADGFRSRCRQRIEKGRVWVLIEHSQLIFKADIISDTPDVIYLEGIYVNPKERGKGYGSRCLSQMSRQLLQRTNFISALVNEEKRDAQRFFQKIGFVERARYDTIFL